MTYTANSSCCYSQSFSTFSNPALIIKFLAFGKGILSSSSQKKKGLVRKQDNEVKNSNYTRNIFRRNYQRAGMVESKTNSHVTLCITARNANLHLSGFHVESHEKLKSGQSLWHGFLNCLLQRNWRLWALEQHIQKLCWCSTLFFRWAITDLNSYHCVTFQRRGTSETCSTDIYSCFSCGCGSLDHICRKLALTWWFFEKSPGEKRKIWKKRQETASAIVALLHTPRAPLCAHPGPDQTRSQSKQSSWDHPLRSCSALISCFQLTLIQG